jgi:PAS domain S-box-containing protein
MIRILLVDHVLESHSSIRKLLLASGGNDFKLDCAVSYRETMEEFRSTAHDVCLIDSAPGNGLRLFAQARSVGCTVPIVLVTSDASETIKAFHIGAADCLIREELSAAQIERSICCVVEQARGSALQDQREVRYLGLINNSDEMIYTHDLNGNFTSMNRTGERILGYSEREILEMNVSQIVVPAYRVIVANMIERTLDAQRQEVEEIELVTRDGRNLTVEVRTHPIYHQGKAMEIQVLTRNRSKQPTQNKPLDFAEGLSLPEHLSGFADTHLFSKAYENWSVA